MSIQELLGIMRFLSALESWARAQGENFPDYLSEAGCSALEILEREIMKGVNHEQQ